jgi:hypothetical protein
MAVDKFASSGSDAYDRFWNVGKYHKDYKPMSGTNAAGSYQVVDSANVRPTSGTNAAGSFQVTDSSNVVMNQPQQQPQNVYGANFGTFTGDAMGKLRAMGMLPNEQAQQDTRDYAGLNAAAMRSQLEALNNGPRATNPYGQDNSGYLASQAQIVGQQGQSLLNGLRDQQRSNALNGIRQDSGLAQNQQNRFRTQDALSRNAALTGLETQRYDKAAEWDRWDTQNRQQLAGAVDSGNLNRFSTLMGQRNTEYEQNRQQPFDALRLASGVQDFEQQGRMNPLDVLYKQGAIAGQGINNEGNRLQNVRYGYGNQYARDTLDPSIRAANSGAEVQYLGNMTDLGDMQFAANDPGMRDNRRSAMTFNSYADRIGAGQNMMAAGAKPFEDIKTQFTGMLMPMLPGGSMFGRGGAGATRPQSRSFSGDPYASGYQ